ncbi:MAG: hypothetical protein CMP49_06695 [Flavobacteriales bacterium]|jgi:hypothetical protein|nr:hypothetical protein [Flavobacteriales bacterium]|tara:strand:+ start:12114 stop:12905 length:792 start_codon:yes stop_codon:yes gene_type:complete
MYNGVIQKMQTEYTDPVNYDFLIGDSKVNLNELINSKISLVWSGEVVCVCGKKLKKFYRQHFCYQCYWNAPEASPSIFKPELCTADLGIEERNLAWEKKFQLVPHCVYLANSSGLKVGITRNNNQLTRWMDQGAVQGSLIAVVPNRRISGLVELELKKVLSDRTNWRKMLSGSPQKLDLIQAKNQYIKYIPSELQQFIIPENKVVNIQYPVAVYPVKVNSLNFYKCNIIEGTLLGIKGQYLLFDDNRVFNVRSHQGFIAKLSI